MTKSIEYKGRTYRIGDVIIVTDRWSLYYGLVGLVVDISVQPDEENLTTQAYLVCDFIAPRLEDQKEELAERFSRAAGELVSFQNLQLTRVVVEPAHALPASDIQHHLSRPVKMYALVEDIANEGETVSDMSLFANRKHAEWAFAVRMGLECTPVGEIGQRENMPGYIEEADGDYSFRCWIDDEYCSNHYTLELIETEAQVSDEDASKLMKNSICSMLLDEFAYKYAQQTGKTHEEISHLLTPELGLRMYNAISNNESIRECLELTYDLFIDELEEEVKA